MSLAIGDPAPSFALPGVDGLQHTSASYDPAEVLVLVQSCNHCPYVLAWEDRLKQVQEDYAARGVSVVAFNSNDAATHPTDSFELMVAHAAERALPFDYLHDADQTLATALGAQRTPEVFVFDRERRLRYHGAIDDNRDETAVGETYLRDALEAVLAGGAPETVETPAVGCTVKWRA